MDSTLFASIVTTGFAVAFLHGALPTHWLPFVLVGQRQGWSSARTVTFTALAGLGHVAVTVALGLMLVATGRALGAAWEGVLHKAAGGLLILFGGYYLFSHVLAGRDHVHGHLLRRLGPAAAAPAQDPARMSDRGAALGLLLVLAFSPCEAFLPVYLSGSPYGWGGFGLLTLVLAAGSILSMTALTALSLAGVTWLGLKSAARYEALVLGSALCLLGVLVFALEG